LRLVSHCAGQDHKRILPVFVCIMGLLSPEPQKIRPNSAAVYVRHRPETTLLYQVICEYWLEFQLELASQGKFLPAYIKQEFEGMVFASTAIDPVRGFAGSRRQPAMNSPNSLIPSLTVSPVTWSARACWSGTLGTATLPMTAG
jgi:hypothetical protein